MTDTVEGIMALADEYAERREHRGEDRTEQERAALRAAVERVIAERDHALQERDLAEHRQGAAMAERDALKGLLKEARAEVEFWTPDECHVSEGELHYLNLWFALRDRIDAALEKK